MTAYTPSYEEWLVSALPQAQMEYADEGLPIPSYGELEPILRSRYVDYIRYTNKRNLCVWLDGQEDVIAKEINSK